MLDHPFGLILYDSSPGCCDLLSRHFQELLFIHLMLLDNINHYTTQKVFQIIPQQDLFMGRLFQVFSSFCFTQVLIRNTEIQHIFNVCNHTRNKQLSWLLNSPEDLSSLL